MFFNLYITGFPSNALDQFLSTSMNIGVATRIFKAVESCCIEIEDICVNHFIKPGENILFLLGESARLEMDTVWRSVSCCSDPTDIAVSCLEVLACLCRHQTFLKF